MKVQKVTRDIAKRQVQPRNIYLANGRKTDPNKIEEIIKNYGGNSIWSKIADKFEMGIYKILKFFKIVG